LQLTLLRVRDLRCLSQAELQPDPRLTLVVGPNGAGKSSLVEAIHVLGYGRSFRGRIRDGLVRSGAAALELYAEWRDAGGQTHRAGLRHGGDRWEARLDGAPAPSLTELCAQIAVVTFEPGSHDLIGGGAEHRRRYLDWGLFHVAREFLPWWRRYARALKQRNAALKSGPSPAALAPWERELAEAGEVITRMRQAYLARLEPFVAREGATYLAELGPAAIEFRPGWKRSEIPLADALILNRDRDIGSGHTTVGPHRADWRLGFAGLAGGEALSRGQEKLAALACILGQAAGVAAEGRGWPLVCLDDLASELDRRHQRQVLESVLASGAQVLLTGTQPPEALEELGLQPRTFHVEHGRLRET